MNPFGSSDEEETSEGQRGRQVTRQKDVTESRGGTNPAAAVKGKKTFYPGDLNPFGDDEDDDVTDRNDVGDKRTASNNKVSGGIDQRRSARSNGPGYDDALNPFGSDDDNDEKGADYNDSSITTTTTERSFYSGSGTPVPRPRTSLNFSSNLSTNSQPVSCETTPVSLRRSIGSNVSRSSFDSRSRKSIIKPTVPPPPAPLSPLRPQRSPKKAAPGRPDPPAAAASNSGKLMMNDHLPSSPTGTCTSSSNNMSGNRCAVVVSADTSPSRSSPSSLPVTPESLHRSMIINPSPLSVPAGDGEREGEEEANPTASPSPPPAAAASPAPASNASAAASKCQIPVARRRISLTPSGGSEATISTMSESTVDSDQSHVHSHDSSQQFHDEPVSLATESSPTTATATRTDGKDQEKEGKPIVPPKPVMKKRPAPAPPQAIRRTVCGSLQSIQFDLNAIGDRLAVIQSRVDHLEAVFSSNDAHALPGPASPLDPKSMISEYLELARETCTLARKQEELMYQRTEHKLEQEHADLEFNIRQIDLIADFKRTPEDEKRSRDLIDRLVDVIDQRNDVVENMTKINKRPDFDKRVQRLRKLWKNESDVDAVLAAFLEANDMDLISTEMMSLSLNNGSDCRIKDDGSVIKDQESGKKGKNKDKKKKNMISKSATLRLPHFKSHKDKTSTSSPDTSSSASSSLSSPATSSHHKAKSSTLKTIKKIGTLKVKSSPSKLPGV